MKKAKSAGTIVLYIVAAIVFLVGAATLVNNIMNYNNIVSSYVAQGYPAEMVTKQLVPGTLLPGIFEPVGLYFGIAFALFGIGLVNKKVSIFSLITDDDCDCDCCHEDTAIYENNAEIEAHEDEHEAAEDAKEVEEDN